MTATIIRFTSLKAGSGVTTVTALTGLGLAATGHSTLLIDPTGDLHTVLGMRLGLGPTVIPNLDVADTTDGGPCIIDPARYEFILCDDTDTPGPNPRIVHVVRNDVVTLTRYTRTATDLSGGVVCYCHPNTALDVADVEAILDVTVTAAVTGDSTLCRAIDAGLLHARHPAAARLLGRVFAATVPA